jgi:hypothetical protein
MTRVRLFPLAVLWVLCGCAYQDADVAKRARQSVVGISVLDLDMCAGLPTKSERISKDVEVRSYERSQSASSGLNLSLPLIGGGLQLGNGGYCIATFKIVDGEVRQLTYAGATASAGLQYALCAPIVRTCVLERNMARG